MKEKLPLGMNVSQMVLVGLLVVASFLLGSLYTKVQFLTKGVGTGTAAAGTGTGTGTDGNAPAAAGKYASFEEAMKALAKDAKLDGDKLVTCMSGGDKKSVVDADVAQGTTLGISGTPAFFINGRLLGGAFPLENFKEVIDKELAGKGSSKIEDYSAALQSANKSGAFDPNPKQIDVGNAQMEGTKGAPITIVEFSDFQCPFCERAYPTISQLLKDYKGKVALYYKHFPLISIHPRAQKSAEAAVCAAEQGKFWEFHNALFENQAQWSSL